MGCGSCRVRVPITAVDTDCIDLAGDGSPGDPLTASPILDPDLGNTLSCGPAGLLAGEPAYEEFVADSQLARQFYNGESPFQSQGAHSASSIPIDADQTFTGTSWQAPQAPWATVDVGANTWTFTKPGVYLVRVVGPSIRVPASFVSDRIGGAVTWHIKNAGVPIATADSRFTVQAAAGGNGNRQVMSDLIFTIIAVPAPVYTPYYGQIMGSLVGGIEVGTPMALSTGLFNWDRVFSVPATFALGVLFGTAITKVA